MPTGSAIVSSGSGSPRPTASSAVADVLDEEPVVLEDAEHAEVERDRGGEDPLARLRVVACGG